MDHQISVRAQEPADIAAVTEVLNQPRAVWGTLQVPHTSVAARQARAESLPAGHTLLVAEIDGRVVGSAGLHPADSRRRAHAAGLGMAVHDEFAGRGVGRALLSALLDLADRWLGYKRLELTVWADNDRAIALYERSGFEREGLFRSYAWRDGTYVDALSMARLRF
jgi:putative acetyltransferase